MWCLVLAAKMPLYLPLIPSRVRSASKLPDFEAPLDADKNNDYRLVITAAVKDKTSQQQVSLKINNVTKPVVELIKPKPYENVGTGEPLEVETLVRFYDVESNSAIEGGAVEINASPLQHSTEDAQVWQGKMKVPQGGVDLSIVGVRPKGAVFKSPLPYGIR